MSVPKPSIRAANLALFLSWKEPNIFKKQVEKLFFKVKRTKNWKKRSSVSFLTWGTGGCDLRGWSRPWAPELLEPPRLEVNKVQRGAANTKPVASNIFSQETISLNKTLPRSSISKNKKSWREKSQRNGCHGHPHKTPGAPQSPILWGSGGNPL